MTCSSRSKRSRLWIKDRPAEAVEYTWVTSTVAERLDQGVLEVLVDEAARSNPLSASTVQGLRSCLRRANEDALVRCVLISSAGEKVFISGADLESLRDAATGLKDMDLFGLFEDLEATEVPVICAVEGLALGGGFELAICADLVLASEQAQFGLPETSLGVAPGIAMIRLHHEIGRHRAKELAFSDRRLTATEARDLGLVNRVVDGGRLLEEARDLARSIARRAPIAVRVTKRAFDRERGSQDWRYVRTVMDEVFTSDDLREGLDAFAARREAHFEGR